MKIIVLSMCIAFASAAVTSNKRCTGSDNLLYLTSGDSSLSCSQNCDAEPNCAAAVEGGDDSCTLMFKPCAGGLETNSGDTYYQRDSYSYPFAGYTPVSGSCSGNELGAASYLSCFWECNPLTECANKCNANASCQAFMVTVSGWTKSCQLFSATCTGSGSDLRDSTFNKN